MLKDSQFAKDVYVADKLLKDAQKSLDKIKSFIDNIILFLIIKNSPIS